MGPSPIQILIVLVVLLLLFGASRLGDVGKGLGEGIKNFKKGISDASDDDSNKQIPTTEKTDAKVVEEKEAKS